MAPESRKRVPRPPKRSGYQLVNAWNNPLGSRLTGALMRGEFYTIVKTACTYPGQTDGAGAGKWDLW